MKCTLPLQYTSIIVVERTSGAAGSGFEIRHTASLWAYNYSPLRRDRAVLRQKQMEARRQRAMNIAESLIRSSGSTDFTMIALSRDAEVAEGTLYNLFGSKTGLLYAVLTRTVDPLDAIGSRISADTAPFARVLKSAGAAADLYLSDPELVRPLCKHLLGESDPVHRPAMMERGMRFWHQAVSGLERAGHLRPVITAGEFAREQLIHMLGVLDLWVQREVEAGEFKAQLLYGTAWLLLGIAKGDDREWLLRQIQLHRRKLRKTIAFKQSPEDRGSNRTRPNAAIADGDDS